MLDNFKHNPNAEHLHRQDRGRHDHIACEAATLSVEVAKTRPTMDKDAIIELAGALRDFMKTMT